MVGRGQGGKRPINAPCHPLPGKREVLEPVGIDSSPARTRRRRAAVIGSVDVPHLGIRFDARDLRSRPALNRRTVLLRGGSVVGADVHHTGKGFDVGAVIALGVPQRLARIRRHHLACTVHMMLGYRIARLLVDVVHLAVAIRNRCRNVGRTRMGRGARRILVGKIARVRVPGRNARHGGVGIGEREGAADVDDLGVGRR